MNLIKKTIHQIKRCLIRFYDFHYMIRYYGEIGNGYGDALMQIFLAIIFRFVIIYWALPKVLNNSSSMAYQLAFCGLIILWSCFYIDYKFYEHGKRVSVLNKVWKNKSKRHNKIMFYLENLFWGMCIIVFMLLAWFKKVLFD